MEVPLVSFIIGTRPEAIKMAPVIKLFQEQKNIKTKILLTGQHKLMVEQVMEIFDLVVDIDLNIMKTNQTLTHITCEVLKGFQEEFIKNRPAILFVQGDTTSAFASSLAAFYQNIPVAHIEAGLRTEDLFNPFPEELNRRLISQIATLNFAPTISSKNNLLSSGINQIIEVTGNTVIDSLFLISKKQEKFSLDGIDLNNKRMVLATIHRRENWGEKFKNILKGIKKIAESFPDVVFLIPMHSNPNLRKSFYQILGNNKQIELTEPLKYNELVSAMKAAYIIITDSGGLQEEAPTFGKPILVVRENTERQEAIEAGIAQLVGTDQDNIFKEASILLNNSEKYESISKKSNPFGDGNASIRILKVCLSFLKKRGLLD